MTTEEEIEKIKKLPPEDRVKKLQEIIKKRNDELSKASKEIEEAKELQEKTIDEEISKLIDLQQQAREQKHEELQQKEIEEIKAEKTSLEDAVTKHSLSKKQEEFVASQTQYTVTSRTPLEEMYQTAQETYTSAQEQGGVSEEMAQQIGSVKYAMMQKEEEIRAGEYTASENMMHQANAVKEMADKILSLYTGGVKKHEIHLR